MLSAGLNLTRNELISTRLRVNSIEELAALANDVAGSCARRSVVAMPEGYEVTPGDLGLAYSTRPDVAHYIPLDASSTTDGRPTARLPVTWAIQTRARLIASEVPATHAQPMPSRDGPRHRVRLRGTERANADQASRAIDEAADAHDARRHRSGLRDMDRPRSSRRRSWPSIIERPGAERGGR